jgi:hypothetical protein
MQDYWVGTWAALATAGVVLADDPFPSLRSKVCALAVSHRH